MSMNIAILGGRFDPPHLGHLWVARQVLERGPEISEVWFMPTYIHPWKVSEADSRDRLFMLKSFEDVKIKVSSLEVEKGGTSYTVETVDLLKQGNPNDKFYWIVGSDAISDFSKWRSAQKLALKIPFLVFPRSGYPVKLLPVGMKLINGDNLIQTNLSSSFIRERIKMNLSINGFVSSEVEEFIKRKNLYK
ncbi:nicotinate (nicotinamide) nucleotide adenylyltransferase [Candidatus Gottesmanbacteria bacterium]|nr:nicotinate (nicotinamide) nucleotide adenylyltransferase [Candidatus Gottesmanbacteria bacterium]